MTGGTVSIYLNDQEVITKTLGEKEETQEDAQQAALVEKSGEVYKVWNNDSGNAPMSWSGGNQKYPGRRHRDLCDEGTG